MVKRATVRAIRPTACSQLPSWRWSCAPLRHSQPEMAARGVINRKHTMSQNSVLFSLRGPGSRNHCGVRSGRQNTERTETHRRGRERKSYSRMENILWKKKQASRKMGCKGGTAHSKTAAQARRTNKKKKDMMQTWQRALTFVTSVRGLGRRSMLNSVWQSSQ